mmetsp:Transcript_19267/g.59309  ORF Transcript_19267/g.59309 Transcript_19267/m.59309 type:complete len:111 (-) Transcript_19267:117-449(-)
MPFGADSSDYEREMRQIRGGMQQQDEHISALSSSVDNLRMMSLGISEELGEQDAMLVDLEAQVDEAHEFTAVLTRRTEQLVKAAGGRRECALITILTIVALILFFLLIYT